MSRHFVARPSIPAKITRGLSRIKVGLQKELFLGNLDAKRDWGPRPGLHRDAVAHAAAEKPQELVIATGEQYSVRDFVKRCAELLELDLTWQGSGVDEKALDKTRKRRRRRGLAILPPDRSRNASGRSL